MGMDPDVINFDDLPTETPQPKQAAPQGLPDVIGFDDLPDEVTASAPRPTQAAMVQPEAPGMLAGAGSAVVRGYQDNQVNSGIAEKFRLRGYKTSLEQGGDFESDIGELIMSGKATPAQSDLFHRRVPQTDPVWRAAELARVTNEMAKLDQSIKAAEATRQNYSGKSQPYQDLQAANQLAVKEGRPVMGTLENLWDNPAGIPEFVAEGAYGTAKPIAGAIAAAIALRKGKAAPLAQKLGPIATSMGITGIDSYKGQVAEMIEEKARAGGIDLRKTPEKMDDLLQDANFIEAVKSDALKAGINDAAWAGISTWLGMTPRIKGIWQPIVQSGAESLTSISQDVVLGKNINGQNAIMSGVAGLAFEGPSYGIARAAGAFGGNTATPPAAPAASQQTTPPPAAPAPAAAAPDTINVDDLPSVAGETVEAPAAPAAAPAQPQAAAPAPSSAPISIGADGTPVASSGEIAAQQPAPVAEPAAAQPEPAPATAAATQNVEPRPKTPAPDAPQAEWDAYWTASKEWDAKHGKTHWGNGTPKSAMWVEGTPEFAAREAEAKARRDAEAAQAQPAPTPAPVEPPAPQPAQPAAPAPVAVEPEATPAPAAEPVATAQPAPSAAYAGGDPKADPRYQGLLRNQRSKVDFLHDNLVNDQKKRERAIAEKRSTKNIDARIAATTAEIESALANVPADKVKPVQPAATPAPVAQPAVQPVAQAEPAPAPVPVAQPNLRTDAENTAPQSPQAEAAPVAEPAPVEQPKAPEPVAEQPKAEPAPVVEPTAEADAPATESAAIKQTDNIAVQRVATAEIKADPKLMQYKATDDAASGVNQADKLTGAWDETKGGVLVVWEPKDPKVAGLASGQKYIVANGHHRLDFAKRAGRANLNVQVLREADGWSALDARMQAAEINIADGKGSPQDAVKYLQAIRERDGEAAFMAATKRVGSNEGARRNVQIARGLKGDALDLFINQKIEPKQAEAIALHSPDDVAVQNAGAKAALKGMKPETIVDVMNTVKALREEGAAAADSSQGTMFDALGIDDSKLQDIAERLALKVAERRAAIDDKLRAVQGAAKRPEKAGAGGVKVENIEKTKTYINDLKRQREELDNWRNNPTLKDEIYAEAGVTRAEESAAYGRPVEAETDGTGQAEIPGTADTFNLSGEEVAPQKSFDEMSPDEQAAAKRNDENTVDMFGGMDQAAANSNVPQTEAGIIAALDKAAAERLRPGNTNTLGPDLIAALMWQTARDLQKGVVSFAKWSADMARKFPSLKGSLKAIWAKAQDIAKRPMDYIRFRALDSIADKVWQNASRNKGSATLRKIANIVFAKAGPDADATENDIPTRINLVRNQFSNIYANIMERFAAEFRDMTPEQRRKWDEDFRAAVIDGTTPSDPKVAKAVADFRNLMRDMLAYQRNAGIEMGDQGGNYFPRNYDADAVEADRDGFVAAAQEMYRKREERLLNKAIADVRRAEKDRPAERRAADKKFGRKEKTDAEYRQEAAEWAQEKIAALEAEFAAKDDDFYKQKAEDWATAITHGDVLGLTLFKTTEGKVTSDSTDARTFTNEEAKLADDFLKKNIDDIMMGYIDGAVRGAEVGRIFGQDGSKFEQMMNQLSKEGVDAETVKETRRLVQKALGVGREQQSQATAAFFDWVNVVLAGAFLGKTFMYNLVLEPISFGIRTGNAYLALKSMADTWRLTLAELGTPSPATRQRIEAKYGSQAAFAKSVTETVAEQVGLIQNEMERAYFNAHWDYSSDEKGSKLAKWISQRIYRANLMSATEKAKVQASIGIARLALRDNARFFTGDAPIQKLFGALGFDTKADKSAAVIMRENGVPDADHKAFAAWVAGLEGKTDAEWQKAVMDPKDPMAKHYRRALQRMSLGMSIKTNPALKMEMSDSVLGRLMMQLMNYSYAYSNLVKDRMYSMAAETVAKDASTIDRLRYAAPLLVGAPLAIMGAAASKALIAGLWPSDDEEKRSKETPMVRKAFNWASFAGMFGPKVEYLFKSFERGQAPGGPVGETIFRGGQAVFAAANDPDSEKKAYNARKQLYNSTVKPLVTGAGAAVHPFFGFLGNAAVNNQDVRESVTGQAPRK